MVMCSFDKNRVATPCIDHHTKTSLVVNSDCKELNFITALTLLLCSPMSTDTLSMKISTFPLGTISLCIDCILYLNLRQESQSQSELLRMHTSAFNKISCIVVSLSRSHETLHETKCVILPIVSNISCLTTPKVKDTKSVL